MRSKGRRHLPGQVDEILLRKRKDGRHIEAGEDYMIEIVGWDCSNIKPVRRDTEYAPSASALDGLEEGLVDLGVMPWSDDGGLAKRDAFDNALERYGGKFESQPNLPGHHGHVFSLHAYGYTNRQRPMAVSRL